MSLPQQKVGMLFCIFKPERQPSGEAEVMQDKHLTLETDTGTTLKEESHPFRIQNMP